MILDNDIENIKVYDNAGVSRIFIDLEINGKNERQGHLDTVISSHDLLDIKNIKPILKNSEILVRINPLYENSKYEIDKSIEHGANVIMLPMFKTDDEVKEFVSLVNGKVRTCLLLETAEALARIDDILNIKGIDEIHIGLNDLHLALGLDFMFELMSGGLVEYLANKIKSKNIPFGVGGIACMDDGMLNGNIILKEHIRLGSSIVILSRTFKNSLDTSISNFKEEIEKLEKKEYEAKFLTEKELIHNKLELNRITKNIVNIIRSKR